LTWLELMLDLAGASWRIKRQPGPFTTKTGLSLLSGKRIKASRPTGPCLAGWSLSGAQRSPQALVRAILVHAHRAILVHAHTAILVHAHRAILVHAHRAILVHAHRSLSRYRRPPVIVRRTVLFVLFMAYISIYYRAISTSFSSLSSHPRPPVIIRRTVARPPRRPDQVLLQQLLRQRPARPGPAERRVRLRNDGDRSAEPSNANKIFRRSSCGSARPGPARPGPARPGPARQRAESACGRWRRDA
jgi:hypothetical protein